MSLFEFNNSLIHNMIVHELAESKSISIDEATRTIAEMSFAEYHKLSEAVVTPPSGQTIAPSTSPVTSPQKPPQAKTSPTQMKAIWPGKGAPVEVGMTVGLKGPNGLPVPGLVSQVDMGAKGVKVKNPTTGQDEWANLDSLEPFMAQSDQNQNITSGQQPATEDSNQIARMRQLAGIKENCSAGATGAGAIAIAPAAMGKVKRREPTDEQLKKEYTPKEAAKTIVGDTKPNQASGELSANLAVRGKKTASRTNNGFKR